MINILYIHGMAEGSLSETAKFIREELPDGYHLIVPDFVINPRKQLEQVSEQLRVNNIDMLIGHSLGGFIAHQFKDMPKILINPSLGMTYSYLCRFKMHYKYPRTDGAKLFRFTTEDCHLYKKLEKTEFEGITPKIQEHTIGLFGKKDWLTRLSAHRFNKHYTQRFFIPGGHFATRETVKNFICPHIIELAKTIIANR